ncbi:unnamed protein product [Adineta steineri]|uniref:Uncharacterized protein n=1 Tax=Adineta steineri TaxID=433720 RepID=A0A820NWY7_9BILA|nr:unnamed protein product [Adineta steineri]
MVHYNLFEQNRNTKSATVLNAVQEYQKQHINHHQPAIKRFNQFNNNAISNINRSSNILGLRSRAIGLNNKFPNKQNLPAYVTTSPKQQPKPITRISLYQI